MERETGELREICRCACSVRAPNDAPKRREAASRAERDVASPKSPRECA